MRNTRYIDFIDISRISFIFLPCLINMIQGCPSMCWCGYGEIQEQTGIPLFITNCSNAALSGVPSNIPNITEYLDLSGNSLNYVSEESMSSLEQLKYTDLRNNSHLHSISPMMGLSNLTKIYVDHGTICCIYETEWEQIGGSAQRQMAKEVCDATIPYTECDRDLIGIISIVVCGITVLISLILNPLVFTVTVAHRDRRKDPVTLIGGHFAISNMLITVYACGILVVGSSFFNSYPYHMEDWLENPGCGILGYILITASLASTVFYTLEIFMIFLKVHYPYHPNKHATMFQLNIGVGITWIFAVSVASIPFLFGRYNAVGLCLPFYAGDFDFSFKYVLLYTAITNVALLLNVIMSVNVLILLLKNVKDESVTEQLKSENRTFINHVVFILVFYALISISEMAFLIMSCIGGNYGQIGREWWARMVILEAIVNPLTGPMRQKSFYRDTRKVINQVKMKCNMTRDSRRPYVISKISMDLKMLRDKAIAGNIKRELVATDSPPSGRTDSQKLQIVGEKQAKKAKHEYRHFDRVLKTRQERNGNNSICNRSKRDVYTLSDSNSSSPKLVTKTHGGLNPEPLGASPMSQMTLDSEISDSNSEDIV